MWGAGLPVRDFLIRGAAMAHGFVDLYEVLNVPPEADASTLRAHITQAYLEAQKNLDHRNPEKRFHFQQLYEVYLPQARHVLLDAARRTEYDRYLVAYRSGQPVVPNAPDAADDKSATATPETAPIDPQKQAAEREAMWSQWTSGLQDSIAAEEEARAEREAQAITAKAARLAAPQNTRPVQAAQATQAAQTQQGANALSGFDGAPNANSHAGAGAGGANSNRNVQERRAGQTTAHAPERRAAPFAPNVPGDVRRAEDVERTREEQRLEMVRVQEQTASIVWGFSVATVVFLLVFAIALWLESYFHSNDNYPIGLGRGSFTAVSFALTLILAGLAGWFGAQEGRRRKASELSGLSYQQLVQRTRK